MFNHITLGSNDLAVSQAFYDAIFEPLGVKKFGYVPDTMILYGTDAPKFMIMKPIDGKAASSANGGTTAFVAPTRAAVNAFHEAGCTTGGTCEGRPGPREMGPPGNYVAYVRDPFGNKLVAVTYNAE